MTGYNPARLGSYGYFPVGRDSVLILQIFSLFQNCILGQGEADTNFSQSDSCVGRCALFIMKSENPKCQCDGLCLEKLDCCPDYTSTCLTKVIPKKSSELGYWVGAIVAIVFSVVVLLAVIYFVAINRKEINAKVGGGLWCAGGGTQTFTLTLKADLVQALELQWRAKKLKRLLLGRRQR